MFKPNHITELENAINETIKNISVCTREKDKEFFRNEYLRLQAIYVEEMKNWIAVL